MWKTAIVATCLFGATLSAQVPLWTPPRLETGTPPELPALAIGAAQVFIELSINPTGEVTNLATLRTTPRHTEFVRDAARRWRFKPATVTERRTDGLPPTPKPVASKALVAAIFRSPSLLGPTQGEVPKDVGSPSVDVALPVATVDPTYPATSLEKGVVMIEALVNEKGLVTEAKVTWSSSPALGAAALAAARQWRFRQASVAGRAVASYAYLIFGFPQPVIGGRH